MICRLCNQEARLRQSHIIPEFIYKPLYDDKHRFHVLSTLPAKGNARPQKGSRERLLCQRCEGHISKYERYASRVFSGEAGVLSRREGKLIHLEGVDYRQFKLFALSVLWRAGISSLKMFEQVSLGPHEPRLREMIWQENAGSPESYPFVMSPVVFEQQVQTGLIIQPTRTRAEGHYGYRFVFGGIAWIYIVSQHKPLGVFREASLSREGRTTMLISDVRQMAFVMDLVRKLHAAGHV
jgi:hypothetical protein